MYKIYRYTAKKNCACMVVIEMIANGAVWVAYYDLSLSNEGEQNLLAMFVGFHKA